MREIKAFQFWVRPVEGSTNPVRTAVAEAALPSFHFTQSNKAYLADALSWDEQRQMLKGTVYLVRSHDLPRAIEDGEAKPLPIEAGTDLGEPMCFAFHPQVGAAMIQYAHTGPRHSVMVPMVSRLCPDVPVAVEPVLRSDMLEELGRKQFFRGIEFALTDPAGVQELRTLGGSVGNAISMLQDTGGVSVRVEITMGHTVGQGLVAGATRLLARKLATIGMANVDGGVRAVKVRGSDGADAPVEELDLLRAREQITLMVREADRSIDAEDACRKLAAALSEKLPALRAQLRANSQ